MAWGWKLTQKIDDQVLGTAPWSMDKRNGSTGSWEEHSMQTRIRSRGLMFIVVASALIIPSVVHARGEKVAVIAPSVSTSMEARSIIRRNGWTESTLREAPAILVVVRSMLSNPLSSSYDSIKELQEGADRQLNIAGEKFHVYIYAINSDLSVTQRKHTSYKADD